MFDDIITNKKVLRANECPFCSSENIEKNGDSKRVGSGWFISSIEQPMKCNLCNNTWSFVFDWRQRLTEVKKSI